MTREEAINMLYGMRANNLNLEDLYTRDKYEALDMAIKALEQEPKWIPVSERFPESYKDVLVYDGLDMFVAWWVESCKLWDSCDDCLDSNTKILAWMPLPMPYKAESEVEVDE